MITDLHNKIIVLGTEFFFVACIYIYIYWLNMIFETFGLFLLPQKVLLKKDRYIVKSQKLPHD